MRLDTINTYENKRLTGIMLVAAGLLTLPYAAAALTGEMKWSAFDYFAAGVLLFSTGFGIEMVLRLVKTFERRVMVAAVVFFVLTVLWVELAVGVFGSPIAGN